MTRPFNAAYPADYDSTPVRRASVALVDAVQQDDTAGVERIMWGVTGDDVEGYVLFDLIMALAALAAQRG